MLSNGMKPFDKILEPHKSQLEKVEYSIKELGPESCTCPDLYLFMHWAYRVEKGWYGFALGRDVPIVWTRIIHDFLEELEKEAPDFKIHQIKLKFGGLRFYVDLRLDDKDKSKAIHEEIHKLCNTLSDDRLVY
jgi:hypothetical protein